MWIVSDDELRISAFSIAQNGMPGERLDEMMNVVWWIGMAALNSDCASRHPNLPTNPAHVLYVQYG
jgi:hypothetical protein